MGATPTMIWKVLGVICLANSSFVLCGADSVPAPPLEMEEIVLPTIPPVLELEEVSFQPEEVVAKTETETIDDEALNEAQATSQPKKEVTETTTSSVTKEIKTGTMEEETDPSAPEEIPALSTLGTPASVSVTTPSTTQSQPKQLSARERQSLIGHLVRISDQKSLVLTEKQKLALQQEINFQNQGYRPFSSASDQKGQTGFPEQPKRVLNFNQQIGQQQQFDFQQPPQFVSQQQFGSQQQEPFRFQQPQQQPFRPTQTDQFLPQLQQQFGSPNEQLRGRLQQQRPNQIPSLGRVNNIQPQRIFQQEQVSQIQPQSNQIPRQQFQANPQDIIRTPQQQEAALKKSLFSALQNSFVK